MNLNEQVSEEVSFKLADGRVLKSVPELLEALKNMEAWVYNHHVNQEKNDFVNWIRDVYKDEELASKLKKAKKQKSSMETIGEVLKKKEKNLQKENSKKISPPEKKTDILNLLKVFK